MPGSPRIQGEGFSLEPLPVTVAGEWLQTKGWTQQLRRRQSKSEAIPPIQPTEQRRKRELSEKEEQPVAKRLCDRFEPATAVH